MLKYTDLKKGVIFLFEQAPWRVLDSAQIKLQRQKPIVKARIRNLQTGAVVLKSFTQADEFEEAELKTKKIRFVYSHRGKYIFSELNDPSKRTELSEDFIGYKAVYLKPGKEMDFILIDEKIVGIRLPIKMDFKVIECPPSFKGDTATGGTKIAIIETGAKINVPMFIQIGDIVRVNTQDGNYVERVKKAA